MGFAAYQGAVTALSLSSALYAARVKLGRRRASCDGGGEALEATLEGAIASSSSGNRRGAYVQAPPSFPQPMCQYRAHVCVCVFVVQQASKYKSTITGAEIQLATRHQDIQDDRDQRAHLFGGVPHAKRPAGGWGVGSASLE